MIIRNANQEDIEGIRMIYNYAILNTNSVYAYQELSSEEMLAWYMQKMDNNFPILVMELERNIVGFASFGTFRAWPAFQSTVEHSVHTHPHYYSKGIAKQLLQELIKAAKKLHYHAMIGGIDANNDISLRLHKKLGFKEVGHLPQVAFKFDTWLDLKFLQLILV